jgi:cell division septation protein DedD
VTTVHLTIRTVNRVVGAVADVAFDVIEKRDGR